MDNTVAQILDGARSHLGDTETVGGEYWTDARLTAYFQIAYSELISRLVSIGAMDISRTAYINFPAFQSVLLPTLYGLADLDEPVAVSERGVSRILTISSTSAATPVLVTTSGSHGLYDNQEVIVSQAGAGANGRWFIDVQSSNTFNLTGSSASAAYNSGQVSTSNERFTPVTPVQNISQTDPRDHLYEYEWEEGQFFFRGATQVRQLKIEYKANGTPPASGALGLNNAGNFLKARTAALAAMEGGGDKTASLNELCFGIPSKGIPGYLDDFLRPAVHSMQRMVWRPRKFRRRRNHIHF
jgi:hypothetical protein